MVDFIIEYEVYRFKIWWKSKLTVRCFDYSNEELLIKKLTELAYKEDLWEIRNLTYTDNETIKR